MGNQNNVVFNRDTGKLSAPDWKSLLHARLVQASIIALAPIGYLGISRAHGVIGKLLRPKTFTVVIEGKSRFRFPSSDYYWNCLLSKNWNYEPELDFFLRWTADIPFVFLDLGANFGYWSERVSAELYKSHKIIAVEASEYCFGMLKANVENANPPVKIVHAAIEKETGKRITLFGDRHAGFSINSEWPGASSNVSDEVETISIDDLLKREKIDHATTPIVVKLDIEGAELLALKGAVQTAGGQTIFLVEDACSDEISDAIRYLYEEMNMSIYIIRSDRFELISSLDAVSGEKSKHWSFQQKGLNLLATSSDVWREVLRPK